MRKGRSTYLNRYEMNYAHLKIKQFSKSEEWFDSIYKNRAGHPDSLAEYDVIVGPIANDTIYDTWGILTSGQINRIQARELLFYGPSYEQAVIKTELAVQALRWIDAVELYEHDLMTYQDIVKREEEVFQKQIADLLSDSGSGTF